MLRNTAPPYCLGAALASLLAFPAPAEQAPGDRIPTTLAASSQLDSAEAQALRAEATRADLAILTARRERPTHRFAMSQPEQLSACYQTDVLCPTCDTYDMLDWLTLDWPTSVHLEGTHLMSNEIWPDKIWYLKTNYGDPDPEHVWTIGDTWDVWLYDSEYIYQYITELDWHQPRNYRRTYANTNLVVAPRVAHGGFPGTRIVSCDTRWVTAVNCVEGQPQPLNNYIVHEVWGPFTVGTWGNIGTQTILKVVYFWGCPTDNPDACDHAETYWFAQQWGLIRWQQYQNPNRNGDFVPVPGFLAEFYDWRWGHASAYFPCY